jgi:hypothetical protein
VQSSQLARVAEMFTWRPALLFRVTREMRRAFSTWPYWSVNRGRTGHWALNAAVTV